VKDLSPFSIPRIYFYPPCSMTAWWVVRIKIQVNYYRSVLWFFVSNYLENNLESAVLKTQYDAYISKKAASFKVTENE